MEAMMVATSSEILDDRKIKCAKRIQAICEKENSSSDKSIFFPQKMENYRSLGQPFTGMK